MNFPAVAKECFQVLRSYDYAVQMYDDDGNRVHEPEEARRLFAKPENVMVAIVDNGESSTIRLYLSDSTEIHAVMGLIGTLRMVATKYNLIFNVGRYDGMISPKEFSTKMAVSEQEDCRMNLVEGMYGTSRTSYLKLENARMIVRHSARVDENMLGARGRNIDSIFVENAVGERSLFPTNQIAPARAMTHHVDNGGSWADAVGQQITRLAQYYADLGTASRHIFGCGDALPEGASDLRERCRSKRRDMRRMFERMCRKSGYAEEVKRLEEAAKLVSDGVAPVDEDRIDELAALVNTENRKLDRQVLETLARVLDHALTEDSATAVPDTVTVLGRPVNREAWQALKQGRIDLDGPPRFEGTPTFTSKTAEMLFKLGAVVPRVEDDSLLNLLSYIAEELPVSHDAEQVRKMRAVALVALDAAGVKLDEGLSPRAPALRAFDGWLQGFHLAEALRRPAPSADPDDGRHERYADDVADEVERDFRVADFLASPQAEEFGYPADSDATDEDRTYPKSYVVAALETYLRREVAATHDEDDLDLSDVAQRLYPQVAARLEQEGFTLTEALVGEDMQLSREDVLLPKNPSADLAREVTKPVVTSPDGSESAADDAYLDRLRSLSGVTGPAYTA